MRIQGLERQLKRLVAGLQTAHRRPGPEVGAPPAEFRQLFDLLVPVLEAYLRRRRVGPEVIDDLIQDSILRIYENLDRYEFRGPFLAYCYRVTCNVFYQWLHQRRRLEGREVPLAGPEDESGTWGPLVPEPVSSEPEPEERVITEQLAHDLRRIVHALPARRRACVELRYFQGFSYREIAGQLGISVGAVGANINFAKHQIKKEWDAEPRRGDVQAAPPERSQDSSEP